MSNTEHSSCESWYAPLKREQPRKTGRKRKKNAWRAAAVLVLVLVLILGSSIAFSGSDSGQTYSQGEMPEDWEDFFRGYFEDAETVSVDTDIPRAALEPDFSLELQAPGDTELSLQQLYERCADTIVAITGTVKDGSGYYWGTGVIASPNGLIVTNAHIIDGCDSAKVTLYNDESYEAKLVGVDAISDLALLKIDAEELPAATFGDISSIAVGDQVAAIGNPLGEDFRSTLTNGIISAIDRGLNYNGRTMSLLQTNTAINQGNSGGALFNMYGQVVGINSSKIVAEGFEGLGFAIPIDDAQSVISNLKEYGYVKDRAVLGITGQYLDSMSARFYGLTPGMYVASISNESVSNAGITQGCIITKIDDTDVTSSSTITSYVSKLKPGDTVTLTVVNDLTGRTFTADVTLVQASGQ